MSSSLAFLAWSFAGPESREATAARLDHCTSYVNRLYESPPSAHVVGDNASGLAYWVPTDDSIDWPRLIRDGDGATVWLHVPSAAGTRGTNTHAGRMANEVLDGVRRMEEFSPPFAVARWRTGTLEIANDAMGSVRLFHYAFKGGDVWTTRMGLAHLFMAEPALRNEVAWSGMSTIGWAPLGATQIGDGHQLAGGSKVRAGGQQTPRVQTTESFSRWFRGTRLAEEASGAEQVRGISQVIESAGRWRHTPVADLSGGRDSRVIAGIGISVGVVNAVRTVANFSDEVSVAAELVRLVKRPIEHHIVEPSVQGQEAEPLDSRLFSQHVAWEGRYLAAAGVRARPFMHFRPTSRASLNGIGGEVISGGALWEGGWRERLDGRGAEAAVDRIEALVRAGAASSGAARALTADALRAHIPTARELGLATAGGAMDWIYFRDRMPNWSNTAATDRVLCPLFAPELLGVGVRAMGDPDPSGLRHNALLELSLPEWKDVRYFEKSGPVPRRVPYLWQQGGGWRELEPIVSMAAQGGLVNFDGSQVTRALNSVSTGEASKREEVLFQRIAWESSFDAYLRDLNERIERLSSDLKVLARR